MPKSKLSIGVNLTLGKNLTFGDQLNYEKGLSISPVGPVNDSFIVDEFNNNSVDEFGNFGIE